MLDRQFPEYVTEFLTQAAAKGLSQKSVNFYNDELRYFVNWLCRNSPSATPDTLTPATLRSWFSDLGKTRNTGGVNCNFRAVRAFLNWLEFEYDLDWKNPIKKVKPGPAGIDPLPEIPLAVVEKLLAACDSGHNPLRDRAILKALIDTGARANELLNLNVGDVNLETGSVYIRKGKGNKKRVTFLGKNSATAVSSYLETRIELGPESPLFINDKGERLKFSGLRMLIRRLSQRAGVRAFGLHSFRRTCALTLYRATHDVLFVSKYLGHSNPIVTTRYLNLSGDDLRESFLQVSPADLLGN